MKKLKTPPRQHSTKAYRVWFDKRFNQLVTYNRYWKKDDWKNLIEVGQLQPHQNPFEQDEKGIFRSLYGRKRYYFEFTIKCNICQREVDKDDLSSESAVEICIECNVKRRAASREAAENGEIAGYKIFSVDEYNRRLT